MIIFFDICSCLSMNTIYSALSVSRERARERDWKATATILLLLPPLIIIIIINIMIANKQSPQQLTRTTAKT